MPRPQLHHSPEDKKAAIRERSKRYYERQARINFYANSRLIYMDLGTKRRYEHGEKINTGKLGMSFLWIVLSFKHSFYHCSPCLPLPGIVDHVFPTTSDQSSQCVVFPPSHFECRLKSFKSAKHPTLENAGSECL